MKVTLIEGFLLINNFISLQPLQVVAHKKNDTPRRGTAFLSAKLSGCFLYCNTVVFITI